MKQARADLRHLVVPTPIGHLRLSATPRGIAAVGMARAGERGQRPTPFLRRAAKELAEYFAGARTSFRLPLDLEGTPFERSVWKELGKIGFGRSTTYGTIAKAIKNPKAVRAVGSAVGRNPVAILLPCHRVLPASGKPGNYAWGASKKRWLLRHEGTSVS